MDTAPTTCDQILMGDTTRILKVCASRVNTFVDQGLLHPVRTPSGIRIFSRAEVEALRAARAEKRLLNRMTGATTR